YKYGTHYRIQGKWFMIKGVVTSSGNYPVANTNVVATLKDPYWPDESGHSEITGTGTTNENGEFSIRLNLPPSTGSIVEYIYGPKNFIHYYDLCQLSVSVDGNPYISTTDKIYYLANSVYRSN
ncbi:MAG TPA: carboxypeptidase-like regulatory domain-containing protein, partial [Clostridia bacterium]